jgi:hypothetical protein
MIRNISVKLDAIAPKQLRRLVQDVIERHLPTEQFTGPGGEGAPMSSSPPFGPWAPGIDPGERMAQFRTLAVLAAAFNGSSHPLVAELRNAERDPAAAERALEIFNALPALTLRRILLTWGGTMWPPKARNAVLR